MPAKIEADWPAAAATAAPPATFSRISVQRWRSGRLEQLDDRIAEELPLALVYNSRSHAVMLASPADLGDFALGFSLSEGIIAERNEMLALDIIPQRHGIELLMQIPPERAAPLLETSRAMAGRSGCGLCGTRTLAQAMRGLCPVGRGVTMSSETLHRALAAVSGGQHINRLTGAVHAAAWSSPDGQVTAIREDVGRHNALDKLIGLLASSGTDFNDGALLLTSRASYEMVQKAAAVGITFVAAISAPTALAVRVAEGAGVTLVGFARADSHVVYAHPWRLPSGSGGAYEETIR